MSKLWCKCGHVISDTTDNLPFQGSLLRSQDEGHFYETLTHEIALFLTAILEGKREEWIGRHFRPIYPRDLSNEVVIADFLAQLEVALTSLVYECEHCGRLWMQQLPGENQYVPYSPDAGKVHRVLTSARVVRDDGGT